MEDQKTAINEKRLDGMAASTVLECMHHRFFIHSRKYHKSEKPQTLQSYESSSRVPMITEQQIFPDLSRQDVAEILEHMRRQPKMKVIYLSLSLSLSLSLKGVPIAWSLVDVAVLTLHLEDRSEPVTLFDVLDRIRQ